MAEKHGTNREISFIDSAAAEWVRESAPEDGLCLKRFHADIEAEGVADWQKGQIVTVNNIEYEITEAGKRCFEECELLQRTREKCQLAKGTAFGKRI